ncbi:hypothetical protein K443DRAFT_412 [Laccaria amethystina LaAM-08-1]|uniref:Uncharacterized protein n=1 Tax=Laccaria amethystina LaAM-08-1 TaxID=1095629 RepID=A0A0C9Y703_9AGAR|nr:hypothetical protein K443DRAFT_412 [Laccaria amethystina LaAM-08-1]
MKQPSYSPPAALSKAVSTRPPTLPPHTVFRDPASAPKPRIGWTQQSPNIPNMPLSSMLAVDPLIGSDASRAGHAISTPPTCDFLPTTSQAPLAESLSPLERRIHFVLEPMQPLRIVKKSGKKPSPVIRSPPLSNVVPPTASRSFWTCNIAIPSIHDPVPTASHTRHSNISQTPLAESLNPVQRRIQYDLGPTQSLRIVKWSAQMPSLTTQRPPLSNVTNIAAPTSLAKPSIDKSKPPSVNTGGTSVINPALTRSTHKTIGSNHFGSITIIRNTPIDTLGLLEQTLKPPLTSIPKLILRKTQYDDIPNKAASTTSIAQLASPRLRSALDSNGAPSPPASDRQPILKSNPRLSISFC